MNSRQFLEALTLLANQQLPVTHSQSQGSESRQSEFPFQLDAYYQEQLRQRKQKREAVSPDS